jgi:uncharacterized protein (TIGR02996 family)
MNDGAAFLRALRASPDDDTSRLVFADWLDERGDPLGEFIRLQFELEPLRHNYDDPRAQELRERESEIIREHHADWLGPLEELPSDAQFEPVFRRGLVEAASMSLQTFLDHADDLERWCPVLREVALFNVRDRGADLAGAAHLASLAQLEVADWLTGDDALALASSPNLGGLQGLQLWLGGQHDEVVCSAFARSQALSNLREVRLLQLLGGVLAGDGANELAARADALAALVNGLHGETVARVLRPFERTFPLRGDLRDWLFAGHLCDGRQVLVACWLGREEATVASFDGEGNFLELQRRQLAGCGHVLDPREDCGLQERFAWLGALQGEMLQCLKHELGFEFGLIRVKELAAPGDLSVHCFPARHFGVLVEPDAFLWEKFRRTVCSDIHRSLRDGEFVLHWTNDFWVGPDGKVQLG